MSLLDMVTLTCGNYSSETPIGEIIDNMAETMTKVINKIIDLPNQDAETITLLGPFYGRTLLESVCTVLIGRFDPFRLLYIKGIQQRGGYKIGKPSKASITWRGDVIDEDTISGDIWKVEREFQKIERGLFGAFYGQVFWNEAFQMVLDFQIEGHDFFTDYRQVNPETFSENTLKSKAMDVYSSLSKGVHSEFVVKLDTIYDRDTVMSLIKRTLEICNLSSLVSHAVDSSICRLTLEDAMNTFKHLKEESDSYDEL